MIEPGARGETPLTPCIKICSMTLKFKFVINFPAHRQFLNTKNSFVVVYSMQLHIDFLKPEEIIIIFKSRSPHQ
jgi:hypothetical protein